MSLVEQLEAQIDAFALWCAPRLCEKKIQDVVSYAELPLKVLKGTPGKFFIRYCREHKRYHLYSSTALHKVAAAAGMQHFAGLIKKHKGQLSPEQHEALMRRLQRQHGLFHVAAQKDRQRYVEWRQFKSIEQAEDRRRVERDKRSGEVPGNVAAVPPDNVLAEFYRCARKQVYAFREQAVAALAAKGEFSGSDHMSVYSCEFCSGFHMGHDPKPGMVLAGAELRRKARVAARRYPRKSAAFLAEHKLQSL